METNNYSCLYCEMLCNNQSYIKLYGHEVGRYCSEESHGIIGYCGILYKTPQKDGRYTLLWSSPNQLIPVDFTVDNPSQLNIWVRERFAI